VRPAPVPPRRGCLSWSTSRSSAEIVGRTTAGRPPPHRRLTERPLPTANRPWQQRHGRALGGKRVHVPPTSVRPRRARRPFRPHRPQPRPAPPISRPNSGAVGGQVGPTGRWLLLVDSPPARLPRAARGSRPTARCCAAAGSDRPAVGPLCRRSVHEGCPRARRGGRSRRTRARGSTAASRVAAPAATTAPRRRRPAGAPRLWRRCGQPRTGATR
jgi:hypothetical protein